MTKTNDTQAKRALDDCEFMSVYDVSGVSCDDPKLSSEARFCRKHYKTFLKALKMLDEVEKFKASPCEGSDFGNGYYSAMKELKEIADGK